MPLAGDLPVEAGVRLEEALVAQWAVEEHLTIGPDLRRSDHAGHDVAQLLVEVVDDERGQRAIECDAADQQQEGDPACRDQHHAPPKRAGMVAAGRGACGGLYRSSLRLLRPGRRRLSCAERRRGRRDCSRDHGSW